MTSRSLFTFLLLTLTLTFTFTTLVSPANLLDTAEDAGLTTLVSLVNSAGLGGTVNSTGPFTVFAPSNPAFAAIASPPSGQNLVNVLLYHVALGNLSTSSFSNNELLTTALGLPVIINLANGDYYVNGQLINPTNVYASNGVAQVINSVLTPPVGPIYQTALVDGFTTLSTLLSLANLATTLNTTGAGDSLYTVFAPTNAAFDAVPDCVQNYLGSNVTALTQVLLYHVIANAVYSATIPTGTTAVPTLAPGSPTLSILNNVTNLIVDGVSLVTTVDVTTTNGVIHVIDRVLLPPGISVATVCNLIDIANSDNLTTLTAEVAAAGLTSTLNSTGPFTVFAPTNAAFAALSSVPTGAALRSVLLYHVLGGSYMTSSFQDNSYMTTAQGQELIVNVKQTGVYVNGVQIVVPNVTASNGVAQVIGSVLSIPGGNIVQVATNVSRFSTLVSLVTSAGLGSTLSSGGPFTVFAPNNTAFASLSPSLLSYLSSNVTALTQVLTYHVLSGAYYSSFLGSYPTVATLEGASITVSSTGGVITVNNQAVITPNVIATNGVIHEIAGVLLPPGFTYPTTTTAAPTVGSSGGVSMSSASSLILWAFVALTMMFVQLVV